MQRPCLQDIAGHRPFPPNQKKKGHDKETRKLQLQLSNHPMIRKLKSKKASSRKTCSKSPFPRCSCSSKNVTHWTSSSNVPDPNSGGRF